jgi:predicted Zn-dependent peptidase
MILNPVFPPDEVDKLIRQRIDGIRSAKDRAESVISRYFNAYLYGRHPYSRPAGGDETSLATISRDDITANYSVQYSPSNFILAAAGDFNTTEMRRMIEERFSSWASKAPQTPPRIEEPTPVQGRRLLLVDKPDSTQTYFYVGTLGITRTNPDRVAVGLVNTLFGGRYTSRLNTALRIDSGLTYGARSSFDQRLQRGPFTISSYTRNATTEKAIDLALEILKNFHDNGVTEAELQSAKAYIKGQFPPSIETSDRLASTIALLAAYGLNESEIDSYYATVDAISLADVRRIIRQYFPMDDLVFVLISKAGEVGDVVQKYAGTVDRKSISDLGF